MANKKHKFIVNKSEEAIWEKGLRSEFEYRDLGIREATSNEFGAQVIRMTEGGLHEATGKPRHLTNFQMFYVLEGEAKFYFDNEGEITVKKGDCYYQPDGLIHDALYMSDDCKLLEITAPADFETKIY